MNFSNKASQFNKVKNKEPKEKKKKAKRSKGKHDGKGGFFKNVDPQEYLKPVQFVSGGFLNNKKDVPSEKQEANSLNPTFSDDDSDDYSKYDVFKHFTFDFNFDKKKDENDSIKSNLKKYNLKQLNEKDKSFFEKYGLGFKILRKMGYEDGIGNKIKTNIAPIELQKKHVTFLEEKPQENSNDSSSDVDLYTQQSYIDIFNEQLYTKNLWKRKHKYRKFWNFKKTKNWVMAHLKYGAYINPNFQLQHDNHESDDEQASNLLNVQNMLIHHIKNIMFQYCDAVKKQQVVETKLRNYQTFRFQKDIYKMHLLILKNVLTYKYLLNFHTTLAYPSLFNNATFNEYIFRVKRYELKIGEDDHGSSADDSSDHFPERYDDGVAHLRSNEYMFNSPEDRRITKLINIQPKHLTNPLSEEGEGKKGDTTDGDLNSPKSLTFEQKLNNELISNYKLLRQNKYFKNEPTSVDTSSHDIGTYKKMDDLQNIFDLINIKNIEIEKGKYPLLLSDLYTSVFFIYENSTFFHLNIGVSRFFLEFLRIYFHNNKELIIKQFLSDGKDVEKVSTAIGRNAKNSLNSESLESPQQGHAHRGETQNVPTPKDEVISPSEEFPPDTSSRNKQPMFNQNDIKYIICLKKIVLMGAEQNSMIEYREIENKFDNIIYYTYVYPALCTNNFPQIYNHIKLFKDALNVRYYKNILTLFIEKKIMSNVENIGNGEIDEHILQDTHNKLSILCDINKQFDIGANLSRYYTHSIYPYLQKFDISENYIELIKLALMENMYKKEIFETVVKRIICELIDIDFVNDSFVPRLRKVLILHKCVDDTIVFLIFKVYFFYNFSKHVCDYLRQLNASYVQKNELKNNEHEMEAPIAPEEDAQSEEQKKLILTNKKKEIYETFKNVKDVFENNLMKENSIKKIMFSILNVIKTYLLEEKIVTFPVEMVLDFDKSKIFSDDNINYYYLYKDIKIPVPLYAVPQRIHKVFELNYKLNVRKNHFTDESKSAYVFSPKKYVHLMNKIEDDVNQYRRNSQHDENMNVKNYIEEYCVQNDILFLQKNDRKINGNVVYSINNFSIYISNNIIYLYENHEWKPTLLRDLLAKL
ncbi:conserved Plasmodium protein, unknown function [Plasmodium knowlesi strain H]|uniref:G-patch domain-containing protein n=3 Tax=Plasmodium knowlesi TaxID=5850 RepID=A0A5K1U0H5_PLAKH|nr:conserved Plasmodium protein, unknown function [Plasmodium knowlesi strain H]OTN67177.1 Uncharacterized protein PKNOH_S07438800 [Plasmodium knowlesi]CAA9988521.1 conserved Plasmodium protein, unknown function [Plasmodium knowlesi strain H]SBO21290.1 conserved Plasmodium protein, unknown function [Plasmodium knowlesi strain H]SBO21744.1 conserved Plasmodium protein, unknown function [Plasmodium knowlesi strain H]VVS77995.1 conserved Plasmodium protein, unknown function [Plasmodium knowlesi s|eukprot:XP_002259496.1 hypothetical protein, conserved in Plasmodium species [Plasmodium knowlesi strain H]